MKLKDIKHNRSMARRVLREVHKAIRRRDRPDRRAEASAAFARYNHFRINDLRSGPITSRWMVGQR